MDGERRGLPAAPDRRVIVNAQDRAARGIADAVVEFLGEPQPVEPLDTSVTNG